MKSVACLLKKRSLGLLVSKDEAPCPVSTQPPLGRGEQAGRENEIVLINKVRGTQARSRGKRLCVGLWKMERGDVEEKDRRGGLRKHGSRHRHMRGTASEDTMAAAVRTCEGCDV